MHAATKDKPHSHSGILNPYDGRHLPYSINAEQLKKLNSGQPVVIKETAGKSGRGIVIQDVKASPDICMDRISALEDYYKIVPKVKSIDIYSQENFSNGTILTGAQFNTAVFFVPFTFFLQLTREPRYNTYSWTLDYKYNSDFDDNTGFWQVMPHPKKSGWTRILYSTEVKLFPWIPSPVVSFLTNSALVESTTWVKKEAEKLADKGFVTSYKNSLPDVSACFFEDEHTGGRYETYCSEFSTPLVQIEEEKGNGNLVSEVTTTDNEEDEEEIVVSSDATEVKEEEEEEVASINDDSNDEL